MKDRISVTTCAVALALSLFAALVALHAAKQAQNAAQTAAAMQSLVASLQAQSLAHANAITELYDNQDIIVGAIGEDPEQERQPLP